MKRLECRYRNEWGVVLDIDTPPAPDVVEDHEVEVGNVYTNTHGKFVLVIAIQDDSAFYITYDRDGQFRNTGRYGRHAITRSVRERQWNFSGRAAMPEPITVEWL